MATAKKNIKKKSNKNESLDYEYGVYAVVLVAVAYGLGSLAIDNGSLITYGFSLAAIYWAIHYAKALVKQAIQR